VLIENSRDYIGYTPLGWILGKTKRNVAQKVWLKLVKEKNRNGDDCSNEQAPISTATAEEREHGR
jgi:hypothetical protein